MITRPQDLNFNNKKISMIIAGVPGIGKTTLALSSPKPLLIDLDDGVSRVETRYRTDTDVVTSYDELLEDLKGDLSGYETLVIDTGGKLLEFMKPYVIKEDPKNKKRDGSLSLQGYGAVKREFARLISYIRLELRKHLIVVFHATEVALKDDITGLRIRIEGGTKDEVWDDMDLGGFVEMAGNNRTIGFSNCDRYYAKGTHGVHGVYEIPNLNANQKNNFLSVLFKQIQDDLNAEVKELEAYNNLMCEYNILIENANNLEEINNVMNKALKDKHHLTSLEEIGSSISGKAKDLGFKYDKEQGKFIE